MLSKSNAPLLRHQVSSNSNRRVGPRVNRQQRVPLSNCTFKRDLESTKQSKECLSSWNLTAKDDVLREFNLEKWAKSLKFSSKSSGSTLVNAVLSDCDLYSDVISCDRSWLKCLNLTGALLSGIRLTLKKYVTENRYYYFALAVPGELGRPWSSRINIEENRFGLNPVLCLSAVTSEP